MLSIRAPRTRAPRTLGFCRQLASHSAQKLAHEATLVPIRPHTLPVQEIFKPTSSCFRGFGRGLLGDLEKAWSHRTRKITEDECEDFARVPSTPERATLCRQLMFCVCSEAGQEVFHLHQNLLAWMKPHLRAKAKAVPPGTTPPKQKVMLKPPGRLQMEGGFLILRLLPQQPMRQAAASSVASSSRDTGGSWKLALARRALADARGLRFFHVGYINYSTFHFSGLELFCKEQHENGEHDLVVGPQPTFSRSLPFLHARVDLSFAWHCDFLLLESTDAVVLEADMAAGAMRAAPFPDIPACTVWKGQHMERLDRIARAQDRAPGRAGGRRNRRSERQQQQAPEPEVQVPAALADLYSDEDLPLSDLVRGPLEADEEAQLPEADEVETRVARHLEAEEAGEAASTGRASGSRKRATSAVHEAAPAESRRRVADPAAGPVEPPPVPPAEHAGRRPGARTQTEVRFQTPIGNIVYYPRRGKTPAAMSAFCTNPAHEDCRRSRTTEASSSALRPGQGRPLGSLYAWLQMGQEVGTREEHIKWTFPNLSARRQARAELMQLPGANGFSTHERQKREDEIEDEPQDIT